MRNKQINEEERFKKMNVKALSKTGRQFNTIMEEAEDPNLRLKRELEDKRLKHKSEYAIN